MKIVDGWVGLGWWDCSVAALLDRQAEKFEVKTQTGSAKVVLLGC